MTMIYVVLVVLVCSILHFSHIDPLVRGGIVAAAGWWVAFTLHEEDASVFIDAERVPLMHSSELDSV